MKTARLLLLLLLSCYVWGCNNDDEEDTADLLQTQWDWYSNKVLVLGGEEACAYQTKPSDMYFRPSNPTCEDDDVYDFRSGSELIVSTGSRKCGITEAATQTKAYQRQGNKLTIDGQEYSIVMLTKDTLILDTCMPLGLGEWNRSHGKLGIKLVRKQ
ncbi:hypothetical protein [Sabulibacter ruber]|uniref:hypothetical protein n=1 Tax=Sabulibacter ruber TaxID=2811901 RepID=UPI001A9667AB|nr:hypothetical protein [Sabulibacter ruber]